MYYTRNIIFIFIFTIHFLGCDTKEIISDEVPDCIQSQISTIENQEVWNPPAKVYKYQYKGQTVYYIPPRCCDFPSVLLDENCTAICSPDGGLTGDGDGLCSDFFDIRTNEELIWEDKR